MPEPFKNWINPEGIRWLGTQVAAVSDSFPLEAFCAQAEDGLHGLELKARVAQVSRALANALPSHWPDALAALVRALPDASNDTDKVTGNLRLWPVLQLVATDGLEHPEASVRALRLMTQRFSAEFAVRPYLIAHPELTWSLLESWVADPNVHVRRWLSEGTRPRLPWGQQLRDSVADPARGLALIDRLKDDPEEYVRLSVSNHLNDIAKDHPALTVATAARWVGPSKERQRLVTHGLRTLLKRGDPDALAVLGFTAPVVTHATVSTSPTTAAIGSKLSLEATLIAGVDQSWMLDWVIGAPHANGSLGRRVVKGSKRTVRAGKTVTVRQSFSLKPVTTRVTRPGEWRVALQVNGVEVGHTTLVVTDP